MSSPRPKLETGASDWRKSPRPTPAFAVRVEPTTARAEPGHPPAASACAIDRPLAVGSGSGNDLVISGAHARDFHGYLEPSDRGPRLALAGEATARVNGRMVRGEIGVMPGDTVEIGANRLVLLLQTRMPRCDWRLLSGDERASLLIGQPVHIGSDPDSGLRLDEPGIAPLHARLVPLRNTLWIQDMAGSGTRINDEPVTGARLLMDGDRLGVGRGEFRIAGFPEPDFDAGAAPLADAGAAPLADTGAGAPGAIGTMDDDAAASDRAAATPGPAPAGPLGHEATEQEQADRRKWATPSPPRVRAGGVWPHDEEPSLRPISPNQLPRPRPARKSRGRRRGRPAQMLVVAVCVLGAFLLGLLLDREYVSGRIDTLGEQIRPAVPEWLAAAMRSGSDETPLQVVPEPVAPPVTPVPDPAAPAQPRQPAVSFDDSLRTINDLRAQLRDDPDDEVLLTHLSEMADLYRFLSRRETAQGDTQAAAQYWTLAELADPALVPAAESGRGPIGEPTGEPIGGPSGAPSGEPSGEPTDATGSDVVAAATRLREAGAITAPPGENAVEILLEALQASPGNAGARALLNALAAEQTAQAATLIAARDFDGATQVVAALTAAGLAPEPAGGGADPLAPAQRWQLQTAAAIVEAEALLRQRSTAAADDLHERLRTRAAAISGATFDGRLAADIGQLLAVGAREARWAARDAEATRLQTLANQLSEPAPTQGAG